MEAPNSFEDMTDDHFALAIKRSERDIDKVFLACAWIEKRKAVRTPYAAFLLSGVSLERTEECVEELIEGGLLEYEEPDHPPSFSRN